MTEEFMENLRGLLKDEDGKKKPRKKNKIDKIYEKPQSIIKLQEDYAKWRIKQGEDCVQPRGFVFSDNNANELTKAIVAHIFCNAGFAARINTTGTYKQKENRYIPSGSRNGIADIIACVSGLHIQIEVKFGSDSPRPAQLQVQEEVIASGGIYIFVKTFDDYLEKIGMPEDM